MSSYPKAFSYYLSRLDNFSRQKIKIMPLANVDFSANDQIAIDLPQGLVDLTTFSLQGYATTNAGASHGIYLPFAEGLIDSVSVEIGGQSVQGGFTNYAELFKVFRDYQFEDKKNFRRILQLEGLQDTLSDTGATANVPFAIYNWLGFLGSVPVLDTTLMPPVRIYIRLAPTAVLTRSGAGNVNVPSYRLSNVRANVDLLDISDGLYYSMIQQRLAQAPLEVPFTTYQTVTGSLGTAAQSLRWSTSADCLEAVIATFKGQTANGFGANGTTKYSNYFNRVGTNVDTSVFRVNGIPYPSIPCENAIGDVFVDTAHTLGASQDTLGSTDAAMNSFANWRDHFWVHAHSFTYPDAEDSHRLVGLSGRNAALLGTWETTGSATNVTPLMWLKFKSILRVGSGRFVETVL